MLPASSLARRPEPSQPGTLQEPRGHALAGPVWPPPPPPPAAQVPVQVSAIWWAPRWDDVLGGTRCSERARPAWPSTVTHQPRAPRPSRRGWTPPWVLWNLLHVTQIPSNPARPAPSRPPRWSGHSHGAGDTRSARAPTGRGYQGKDRLGQAQHVQVPCGGALGSPRARRGAQIPPHPGHQAGAHSPCRREEGAPAGNAGVRLASGPAGSLPPGLPPPRGPSAHKSPLWCGISHTPVPPLPRFLAKFQVSCRPARPPSPCPGQRCWAPTRCHPGGSRPPCPESSSPLQRPCKSRFG